MENCNMKRGFFFLRDCDHPAHQNCTVCGKAFCDEHLRNKPDSNEPICLDCLGKSLQQQPQKNASRSHNQDYHDDYYYDSLWCYGYRNDYYDREHYSPWYFGQANSSSQFNDHDVRVFESSSAFDNQDAEAFDSEANVFDS